MACHWGTSGHVLVDTPWGRLETTLPVAAEFALAGIAASLGVLLGLGHRIDELREVLPQLQPIPGRMQVIDGKFGTPKVIVDFAHTPDALKKCCLRWPRNAVVA